MFPEELEIDKVRLSGLFPIPLLEYLWPASERVNEELSRIILARREQDSGIITTNVGGWHSKKDLQTWGGVSIELLLGRMLRLGQEMVRRVIGCDEPSLLGGWTVEAWANINRRGDFNKQHHHIRNRNLWSGVYYVDVGVRHTDTSESARIVFADRNRVEVKNRREFNERYSVRPIPGLMLLFPSALGHQVEVHRGSAERITIAFNLKHDSFTTIKYEAEGDPENKG